MVGAGAGEGVAEAVGEEMEGDRKLRSFLRVKDARKPTSLLVWDVAAMSTNASTVFLGDSLPEATYF